MGPLYSRKSEVCCPLAIKMVKYGSLYIAIIMVIGVLRYSHYNVQVCGPLSSNFNDEVSGPPKAYLL
jgi:hypothetical protein